MRRPDYDTNRHRPLITNDRNAWAQPIVLILLGVFCGWWAGRFESWGDVGSTVLTGLPTLLFMLLILRLGRAHRSMMRQHLSQTPSRWTRVTEHPLAALLAGVPGTVTALVTGAPPGRALLIGVVLTLVLAANNLVFAHLRRRSNRVERVHP